MDKERAIEKMLVWIILVGGGAVVGSIYGAIVALFLANPLKN